MQLKSCQPCQRFFRINLGPGQGLSQFGKFQDFTTALVKKSFEQFFLVVKSYYVKQGCNMNSQFLCLK